ncbi:hypothetical protein [Lysinibacillus sp. OF-1]|uniref:hypothetical protein n=1 Tax=Lysinibacillus sp. OF-1 TaxID=2972483 RepID=UPI00232BC7B5|nr:hypothetical protein [Lysinibacillus sp. OF-1]WCH47030.1 hypothetical protein NV349_18610 [Lysinibacillus sp. OF-1]
MVNYLKDLMDIEKGSLLNIEFMDEGNKFKINSFNKKIEEYLYNLLREEDKEDIQDFYQYLKDDLVMELLYDAVQNIIVFFSKSTNKKKFKDLSSEFFFKNSEEFNLFLNEISLDENVKDLFYLVSIDIYDLFPKILFPWYVYALSKTIESKIKFGEKISKPIDQRRLRLHNLQNSHLEKSEEGRSYFENYIKNLRKTNNKKINKSLCLLAFNKVTNLFDLNSMMGIYEYSSVKYKFDMTIDNNDQLKSVIRSNFNLCAHLIHFSGMKTRCHLFETYETKFLKFEDNLFCSTKIFEMLKNTMKEKIIEEFDVKSQINIPSEIQKDYFFFYMLQNEELYIDLYNDDTDDIVQFNWNPFIYKIGYETLYDTKQNKLDVLKEQEEQEEQVQQEQQERLIFKNGRVLLNDKYRWKKFSRR